MFVIEETIVDASVVGTRFACDLDLCKGGCCTIPGGLGAPLLDEETSQIRSAFPAVKKYLSPEHLDTIEQKGMFEGDRGRYSTLCHNHCACVFVTYDGDIARCAFEVAYLRGETTWRKPLSCHLFPLRVDRDARPHVRFEFLSNCTPALHRGEAKGIPLIEFTREAIERAFGRPWLETLQEAQQLRNAPRHSLAPQ